MKVLFAGSRWLGARVLEGLVACPDLDVRGAYIQDRGWEGTDMEALCERLGVIVHTKYNLHNLLVNGMVDLVVSCCTSYIFSTEEIEPTKLGIINLHPAPLPAYRGCNTYNWAIWNDERQYGVTLHYVTPEIDAGPIIAREWLPIEPQDTARSLYDRAQCAGANLFTNQLERIVTWGIQGQRVPGAMAQFDHEHGAGYYTRDSLEMLRVTEAKTFEERERLHRALWFPPFTEYAR